MPEEPERAMKMITLPGGRIQWVFASSDEEEQDEEEAELAARQEALDWEFRELLLEQFRSEDPKQACFQVYSPFSDKNFVPIVLHIIFAT